MAEIKNLITGELLVLHVQHTFGRYSDCTTQFDHEDTSRSHASINWKSGSWYLQDYSRNGTLLDGSRVHNQTIGLNKKSIIQFSKEENSKWQVVNIEAPSSYLKCLNNKEKVVVMSRCSALPNDSSPEVLFMRRDTQWIAESSNNTTYLEHRVVFKFIGEDWLFVENESYQETFDHGHIQNNAKFKFLLSSDEEDVQLKIVINTLEMNLGSRNHHFLLLVLARARQEQFELGYTCEEVGWISMDEASSTLGRELLRDLDHLALNMFIHRLRKQLKTLSPYGPLFTNMVERRKNEIRFAYSDFEIVKSALKV